MKPSFRLLHRFLSAFFAALLSVSLSAASPAAPKKAVATSPAAPAPSEASQPPPAPSAREASHSRTDIIQIRTKLRYTTLIVLPENERILDFTTGDKEFWIIDGVENMAYVKPAQEAAQTNLNLVAASGRIYSFLLSEISRTPEAQPDLKVFVKANEEPAAGLRLNPRFVSSQQVEDYRQQVEVAKEETRLVKEAAQREIDESIAKFIFNVRFPYRFEAGKKPFSVRAMYHDDKLTFIQARPEETPALYELKDGKPNLVNFEYRNGVYVVDKILGRGYLAIGKQKLPFTSEE